MELGIRTVPEGRLRQSQAQVPRLLYMFWTARRFHCATRSCGAAAVTTRSCANYSTVVTAVSTGSVQVIPAQRPFAKVLVRSLIQAADRPAWRARRHEVSRAVTRRKT